MSATSRREKGRDATLSRLDVSILALGHAKDTCGIPPAQFAFKSARDLLRMIRVRFPPFCKDELLTQAYPGHADVQRSGVRRPWAGLR